MPETPLRLKLEGVVASLTGNVQKTRSALSQVGRVKHENNCLSMLLYPPPPPPTTKQRQIIRVPPGSFSSFTGHFRPLRL